MIGKNTECDPTRIEDEKRQNDLEMDLNQMPDNENRDMITNEVNNKAQEPEMHKEIPINDEGNKTKDNNNMIAKDEQEGATDEMKEPKNDKTQEPEMHKEMPIHDDGNQIKGNNMIAKDKERAADEMKEPKNDNTTQNIK